VHITTIAIHKREKIIHRIDAHFVCFLHKATIPKIKAKIQQIIQRIPPMIVRHKNHQTKAKTKLAIASQFHQFVFSSIFFN
jgi:hypothetical protein